MDKLKVFISSTMEDLQEEREKIVDAVNGNKFREAIFAESFIARSKSPREVCLEEVRNSHIYIGVFKEKYGYVPKSNNPRNLSAVAVEYEEAKSYSLPIFIFISKDSDNREFLLTEFLGEIEDFDKGHWRKKYSSAEELGHLALDAINYEITRSYIELSAVKRRKRIQRIYELPYFKKQEE